jgi:hypothetical protein
MSTVLPEAKKLPIGMEWLKAVVEILGVIGCALRVAALADEN